MRRREFLALASGLLVPRRSYVFAPAGGWRARRAIIYGGTFPIELNERDLYNSAARTYAEAIPLYRRGAPDSSGMVTYVPREPAHVSPGDVISLQVADSVPEGTTITVYRGPPGQLLNVIAMDDEHIGAWHYAAMMANRCLLT